MKQHVLLDVGVAGLLLLPDLVVLRQESAMRRVQEGPEEASVGKETTSSGGGRETHGDGAARGFGGGGREEEGEGEEETVGGGESPWTPAGRKRRRPGRHGAGWIRPAGAGRRREDDVMLPAWKWKADRMW